MELGITQSPPSNSGLEQSSQDADSSLRGENVTVEVAPEVPCKSTQVPSIAVKIPPTQAALVGDENMTQQKEMTRTINSIGSSGLGERSASSSSRHQLTVTDRKVVTMLKPPKSAYRLSQCQK